jgi:hypothetical protein
MKDGLALIHKIWSNLKEKECCRRVVNVERGKWRNVNKIGIRSSWMRERKEREKREGGEREREVRKRGEREKKS